MRDFAYQAQLVEQECGSDYFGLLQALDTDRWNGCHDTVAALAGAGFVRAVVTTNFDTLTEQALAAERVEHRVHFTPDSWPGRAARFDGGHAPAAGARPHRGPRRRAEAPVRAPPPAGSRIASGSLPDWLDDLARNLGVDRPPRQAAPGEEVDRLRAERLAQVAGRAAAWAAELGDMAAINVMAALLRGSGNDEGSFRLLQQVWKHYRRSEAWTRSCTSTGPGNPGQEAASEQVVALLRPATTWSSRSPGSSRARYWRGRPTTSSRGCRAPKQAPPKMR
jgi:hypothetical protein